MKTCNGCGVPQDSDAFTRGENFCRSCRKAINKRNNPRNNHIKRWARLLSGLTVAALYALPKEDRQKWLNLARDLVESGSNYITASANLKKRKDGVIYIISHPRLTCFKIGRAFDADSRLANYQTGCPNREYRLRHVSSYVEDCYAAEADIHELLETHQLKGEWFDIPLLQAVLAIQATTSKHNSSNRGV